MNKEDKMKVNAIDRQYYYNKKHVGTKKIL